jgi:hypothetical protein
MSNLPDWAKTIAWILAGAIILVIMILIPGVPPPP